MNFSISKIAIEGLAIVSPKTNFVFNGLESDIKEVHVMSKNGVFPCFICRQALSDYCSSDVKVYAHSINDDVKSATIEELCTYAFGRSDL